MCIVTLRCAITVPDIAHHTRSQYWASPTMRYVSTGRRVGGASCTHLQHAPLPSLPPPYAISVPPTAHSAHHTPTIRHL
eukprot:3631986-Rhodomonas_salina.1